MIDIFTDGSCIGNPGPGGWAAIIVENGGSRKVHGRDENTTNNRMEVLAAIQGIEATPSGVDVCVHSDSSYLINTMTKGLEAQQESGPVGQTRLRGRQAESPVELGQGPRRSPRSTKRPTASPTPKPAANRSMTYLGLPKLQTPVIPAKAGIHPRLCLRTRPAIKCHHRNSPTSTPPARPRWST